MYLTIQKWGNSLALRIPKAVARQVNVRKGSRLDMSLASNKIILRAMDVKEYRLSDLLEKIHKKNLHGEISFGRPLGKEVW